MKRIKPAISLALFVFMAGVMPPSGRANTPVSFIPHLRNTVNFSEDIFDKPFFVAFPDGEKVAAGYDLGIPLGAEKPVLEGGIRD